MAEPAGPLRSPGFWLHHAALAWRREVDSKLRPAGLTYTQFVVLASASWLGKKGSAPTQQEVAEFAGTDRMMTSKVVTTLEDRALIERTADSADSRAKRLHVTVEGRTVVSGAVRVVAEVDSHFFGDGERRESLLEEMRSIARG